MRKIATVPIFKMRKQNKSVLVHAFNIVGYYCAALTKINTKRLDASSKKKNLHPNKGDTDYSLKTLGYEEK